MKYIYYIIIVITIGHTLPLNAAVVKAPKTVSCANELKKAYRTLKKRRVPSIPPKAQCPAEHTLMTWFWLLKKNSRASFYDHLQFIKENPTYPELKRIKEHAELSIKGKIPVQEVIKYFEKYPPVSPPGAIHYVQALFKIGQKQKALNIIHKWWRKKNFSAKTEREFYKLFKKHLTNDDYKARLDRLIAEGNYYGLQRMKPRVNKKSQKLITAAIALSRNLKSANKAVNALPKRDQLHPGIAFQRVKWRLKRRKGDSAYDLFLQAEKTGKLNQLAEYWFKYRYYFARKRYEDKDYKKAYEIISKHGLSSEVLDVSDYAAAEWLAGWLKLRYLNDPKTALTHFRKMYNVVVTPISQAKGAYWIARCYAKMGNNEQYYKWMNEAAENSHVFYGQMACAALKKPLDLKINQVARDPHQPSRNDQIVMDGIKALAKVDPNSRRLRKMLFDLARYSDKFIAEAIVELAVQIGRPEWAVVVAKIAGRRDPPMVKAAYPIKKLPARVYKMENLDSALVHSLMRQESGFNPKAKSPVGARGLMQIMPRTARLLSRQLKLPYALRKLTANPEYNMILGCHYVSQMLKEFKGSKVKTLCGYNAGESRARKWSKIFGEPGKETDIIDWIESIPFSETRSYVMRVMESYPIYQELLKTSKAK